MLCHFCRGLAKNSSNGVELPRLIYIYIFIYKEYNISYLDHEPGKSNVKHLSLFVAQALLHHEAAVTYMYLQVCKKVNMERIQTNMNYKDPYFPGIWKKSRSMCLC